MQPQVLKNLLGSSTVPIESPRIWQKAINAPTPNCLARFGGIDQSMGIHLPRPRLPNDMGHPTTRKQPVPGTQFGVRGLTQLEHPAFDSHRARRAEWSVQFKTSSPPLRTFQRSRVANLLAISSQGIV
jgi:hypothetical protein